MGWTTLRAWVTRLVAVAVLVSGIGLVDIAVTPPSADAAATWSPQACSPNSSRVSTDASAGGSAYECIANYRAHSNRGRLQHLIDPVRSSNPDEVYDFSEGIAEYVAQGRLISKLSGGSQTAVSPNFQWETTMPADARRLDVMTYSPGSSTGTVQVVELKGEWLATAGAAATQAQGYVTAIPAGSSHSAALWLVQGGGYTDSFYRGKRCDAADPGKVDGWRYTVSAPQAGVVFIVRTPSQCTGTQKLTATQRAKVVKAETAMELAEDGDDIPAETMPTGTDANENGVPDYLDVAAYAGAGNVTTTHATTPYVEWETAVNEVTSYLDLVHLDDLLRKLTRQYGEAATRKILDVIVRAMFSTANHLDQTVIERAVVRELSGIVIERELASVVGKAAASTIGAGIIDAGARVIERNGVKFLERTLGEAAARTLADLLVRYAARLGMTAPIGLIPVVGEVVLFILDVYFTVELILDLADLLGFNIWGDPHLVTMDRRIYDLQSAGEFVLSHVNGTGSVAQGRFVPSGTTISLQRRVALGDGADRFELTDIGALLDGQAMTLDGFTVTGSGMVLAHVGPTWLVTTKDGLSLLGSSVSNVRVVAGDGTSTSGLLGNNDGDPANDLALADGTVLTAPSLSTLHGPYADSWRITQASSLFTYPSGESTTTYTDRSFPQNVVTLGDFSPAQIDAANASCISSGVASGAMMDACVLDLLVTSDGTFAAAAAATRSVVDYAAATFDAAGVLRQGFDATIPMAMQFPTIVQVSDSSRAVGPLFDASPYGMALLSVPRHDGATVKARVIVLGSAAAQDRQVSIVADGVASGAFSLEGAGGVLSGPSGSSIVADGTGVTPAGTAYRAYQLSVPVTHFGDALKLQFAPKNFFAILGSGLAVDSLEISLTVSPADSVSGLTVPFTAAAALGAGLGSLETPGAGDEYHFALTAAKDVLLETSLAPGVRAEIRRDSDGSLVSPTDSTNHLLYRALPPGSYRLAVVSKSGAVASYTLPVLSPVPQSFSYVVGRAVTDGSIGGVARTGAGNLETTASRDVYPFTLTTARTVVFDSEQYNWLLYYGSSLVRLSDGSTLGPINGHREYALAVGSYQIVIDAPGRSGAYAFTSFIKPSAQTFSYAVGKSVSNGLVGGVAKTGAGNLETTASKDVYPFTLTAARTVVFDSEQYNWPLYYGSSLVRLSDGVSLGRINGHVEYALAAGSYQVVVDAPAHPGTYAFTSFYKPGAQSFSYAVGQSVSDGLVGGVAKAGAGNLETTASKDTYSFSLTAAQTVVFDSEQYNWPLYYGSSLVRLSDGVSLGRINGHVEYSLAAGSYQIVVDAPAHPGTYTFTSFVKPAAQTFSYAVGKSVSDGLVGGVAKAGAGNLETTASKDVYPFTLTAARTVVFDSEQYNWPLYYGSSLVRLSDGVSLGRINGHVEYALAAGSYQVVVDAPAHPGTYAFTSFYKPGAQSFSYAVGQSVSDGLVGGVAKTGAGNLETTASKDTYSFSLTAAQTVVFDSELYNWILYYGSSLVRVSDGVNLGPINGHRVFDLAAGSYRIVIDAPGRVGTYSFTSYVKPAPQSFSYEVGQSVADGLVGGVAKTGAGNLETTSSRDVYSLSLPAAQTVVFDSEQYNWILYYGSSLVRLSDGVNLGPINGHRVFDLAPGSYQVVIDAPGRLGAYAFTSTAQ